MSGAAPPGAPRAKRRQRAGPTGITGSSRGCGRDVTRGRFSTAVVRRALVVALIAACSGATEPDDARAALLRDTLIRGDQVWRVREPGLVAQKLALMAGSRFAFLRGTARLYWDDLQRGTPIESTTAYGSAAAAHVQVIGDPHLENLGTFRAPTGAIVIDWNDFDASTWGPYWGDARRLAVACYVAGLDLGRDDAGAAALAERAARGYAEEIAALAAGPEAPLVRGAYLDDLAAKAAADGDADKLAKYTLVAEGVRTMRRGVIEAPIDGVTQDELVALDLQDATALAAAIGAVARDGVGRPRPGGSRAGRRARGPGAPPRRGRVELSAPALVRDRPGPDRRARRRSPDRVEGSE